MICGEKYWSSALGMQDRQEFLQRFPSLLFCSSPDGQLAVRGLFEVVPSTSYSINLLIPRKYPGEVPTLYCDRGEIPWEADRHIFVNSGIACLCARSEFRTHWPTGSMLTLFFERLIIPFLAGQFYYQTHGVWPSTGQRSHGPKGILEAYREMAVPLGDVSVPTLLRLMRMLARDNSVKGHELCPCGSGQILRKCHFPVLRKLRDEVQSEHARSDLEYLLAVAQRMQA